MFLITNKLDLRGETRFTIKYFWQTFFYIKAKIKFLTQNIFVKFVLYLHLHEGVTFFVANLHFQTRLSAGNTKGGE